MRKFSKILIANRGEIALRIIRAARAMHIAVVAIYSDEEKQALYVQQADEAYSLDSGSLGNTYLNIEKIISIARKSSADAIHPGYGFLSENPIFASACNENGITFIGPGVNVLNQTGNKTQAKAIAKLAGVPVPEAVAFEPSDFNISELPDFRFPLMIKAAHGGGGKGMQLVNSKADLIDKAGTASRLAKQYFGNGEIFIEEYIENARHIEVQVLADHYGNMLHLYERDCTVQRKHQKIIEEAPAMSISDKTRNDMHQAALSICREVDYTNAGTVEFLVNDKEEFFFLEINPRIQVEHRVSELITGTDIVQWQLKIAAGNRIDMLQDEIITDGHAIEARLYAEDPAQDFAPSGKAVESFHFSENKVFVEHAISVDEQSGQFDPLLAKIIVWDNNRDKALLHMDNALGNIALFGPENNLGYLQVMIKQTDFCNNLLTTNYCHDNHTRLLGEINELNREISHEQLVAAAVIMFFNIEQTFKENSFNKNWRIVQKLELEVAGQACNVIIERTVKGYRIETGEVDFVVEDYSIQSQALRIEMDKRIFSFFYHKESNARIDFSKNGKVYKVAFPVNLDYYEGENVENIEGADFSNIVKSPLHGKIVSINIKQGQTIKKGDVLLTIESMKSENAVRSTVDASVKSVSVQLGQQVTDQSPLVYLEKC